LTKYLKREGKSDVRCENRKIEKKIKYLKNREKIENEKEKPVF